MKCAVCFSGQFRSLELSLDNIIENLIIPNNCDIFIHSFLNYDCKKYTNYYNLTDDTNYGSWNEYTVDEVLKKLKPKKIKLDVEMFKFNTKNMYYSIQQSNNLKKEYEIENNFIYSYVVRIRYDAIFTKKINLENYNSFFLNIRNRAGGCGELNESFAISNSEIMNNVCDLYNEYKNTKRIEEPCPEGIMGEYIHKYDIKYKFLEDNLTYVIRKNGIML